MKQLIVTLVLIGGFNFAQAKIKAQTGMDQIMEIYKAQKRQALELGATKDIALACMGLSYIDWFTMYRASLEKEADLPLNSLDNYDKFAKVKNYIYDRDQLVFESFRPGVIGVIDKIRAEKKANGEFHQTPTAVPLEDIKQKDFVENLADCAVESFLVSVNEKVPLDFAPDKVLTVTIAENGTAITHPEDAKKDLVVLALGTSNGPQVSPLEKIEETYTDVTKDFNGWIMEIGFR